MEPERLILRSLAGKSRGWLVVDSGCACRNFARGVTFIRLSGTLQLHYITYPGKKKYQVGKDRYFET